jgi:hypothetical protein
MQSSHMLLLVPLLFTGLRAVELSLGYIAVGLRPTSAPIVSRLLRGLAPWIPGLNLIDFGWLVFSAQGQTFLESKMGVRITSDTLR